METNDKYCIVNIKYTVFEKNLEGEDFHIEENSKKIVLSDAIKDINEEFQQIENFLKKQHQKEATSMFSRIKKYIRHHLYTWKNEYYELLKI
ncbi:hypothetical protein SAMN04487906_1227 [Zhouia amylolytica]|uniref:Uncharacterized protein n=2 Tax=Zhouia amylolytica TaxID=376730 RepID=W2UN20_9FLAO|nr:hypothetical protein [Zhouia amylolytica]ETN94866.1 hypothetical protein P278_20240 [Zhouia amylolytica AD3]MCQ0112886.1 hypothetical protein [Zhouia amylolytica]SFS66802.1 hypothetical protein SAMN04487906_1227 [Zhouia amylolytica]